MNDHEGEVNKETENDQSAWSGDKNDVKYSNCVTNEHASATENQAAGALVVTFLDESQWFDNSKNKAPAFLTTNKIAQNIKQMGIWL